MKTENLLWGFALLFAIGLVVFGKMKTCVSPSGELKSRPWLFPCGENSTAIQSAIDVFTQPAGTSVWDEAHRAAGVYGPILEGEGE